jgi:hypothetical protein
MSHGAFERRGVLSAETATVTSRQRESGRWGVHLTDLGSGSLTRLYTFLNLGGGSATRRTEGPS